MADQPSFSTCMAGGALAGLSVDMVFFPIDTIKTRLQSAEGFVKAGAFRGIYKGLASCAVGSMPSAAAFFGTYESSKHILSGMLPGAWAPVAHMGAAAAGEVAACSVRVPFEVVKQNLQANVFKTTGEAVRSILKKEGALGFYRGYLTTVLREVPFSFIQFPIYERLKALRRERMGRRELRTWEVSACGSLAGGFSAAVTTPLDVAKTRIMLRQTGASSDTATATAAATATQALHRQSLWAVLKRIYQQEGAAKLFSGITPRVAWISFGGAVFFGVYERAKGTIHQLRES